MTSASFRDIQTVLRDRVVPSGGTRHGLVIGIENYGDPRLNLRCARADAEAIYRLMLDKECGLFPEGNVQLLLDGEATKDRIWREMSRLRRAAGPSDTVWIYYAGHGAPEGKDFFWVTHGADVDDLYGTALSRRQITEALEEIQAQRLLVMLDCCHAAATAAQAHPTRETLTAERILAAYKGKGRMVLSASDGHEKSVELPEEGHGAFTFFVERGLRGEADTNDDGVVTADELWGYLRDRVADASRRAGRPQMPVCHAETMSHDLALTLNAAVSGRRKQITEAITALIGLGEDRLTTEEAEMCLEILRRGPRNEEERGLNDEFEGLAAGTLRVRTFKRLIQVVLCRSPQEVAVPSRHSAPRIDIMPSTSNLPDSPKISDPKAEAAFLKVESIIRDNVVDANRRISLWEAFLTEYSTGMAAERARREIDRLREVMTMPQTVSNSIGMKFILIQPGTFLMGSDQGYRDEKPVHRVTISQPFYMGVYPVTQAQYKAIMGTNPSYFARQTDRPAEYNTWDEAMAFCRKISERENIKYRLPTEAEWEYVCRAGSQTEYCYGEDKEGLEEYAWYGLNSDYWWGLLRSTKPVGQKRPNAWGLYDMHGNVWEWCSDWYAFYEAMDQRDPTGAVSGKYRVARGGSWRPHPGLIRSAARLRISPNTRRNDVGLRVVRLK